MLLLSIAAIRGWQKAPYIIVGWIWFVVTLLPVIGLVQVGLQSMADRYFYIPLTGLFIMAAWGTADLTKGMRYRQVVLTLFASAVIIMSTLLTWHQLGYWQDNITLFRHTLKVTSGNYLIHNNLGSTFASKGDLDSATQEYIKAIQIQPNFDGGHYSLGFVLSLTGNIDAAIQEYQKVLWINPSFVGVHNKLGRAFVIKGNIVEAINEFQEELRLNTGDVDNHISLGVALLKHGEFEAAIREYQEALRINPDNKDAHYNLGDALTAKGNLDSAINEYRQVLKIDSSDSDARVRLKEAIFQRTKMQGAVGK